MQRANRPDNQWDPRRASRVALSSDILTPATLAALLLCATVVAAQAPPPRSELPLAEPVLDLDVIFKSNKNLW